MTDIPARLREAADHLDHLYEGAKHIPTDMFEDEERNGYVRTSHWEVALFRWGGAAEVFLALGPAALPLLAEWLRATARVYSGVPGDRIQAALAFAEHILKTKAAE